MTIPSTSPVASSASSPGLPVPARDLTEVLDILTHQTQGELGNIAQTIFFMTDGLQRAVTDGFFDLFAPKTWYPTNLLRLSSEAVRQTVQLARLLDPQQANLAWQELRNKLEVFILVKNLSCILHLLANQFIPLPELVEKAYSVSPFAALWAVEGLGHYYADIYWEQRGVPRELLVEAPVPPKSLLMLHAGMGLSFADRLLGELTSEASSQEVRGAIVQFLDLCKRNSRRGYLGAAVESLGLVTRDFYPDLVRKVEVQLQQVGPEFMGFFWHGVGRALYFSREYFLPVLRTVWSGVDAEVNNCPDRLSAMAGLTWAVTLVNMRQPAIMENVLRSYIERSSLVEGFTNGLVSSIIMRTDTTPDAPFTEPFYLHQPRSGDRKLAMAWQTLIAQPAKTGLDVYYPALQKHEALDQIFRYQDLAVLYQELQNQRPPASVDQYAYQT